MATRTATLAVKITGDASDAARAMDSVSTGSGKFKSGMGKAAKYAAIGGGALLIFGKQAFDAASTAQQSAGAVDAVFGKQAKTIHNWSKDSADATGLASSEYEDMAATFGAQLKNMGTDTKKLAPKTDDLITMGADLAAQFGGPTSDAVAALSSLLRGETDPIERYGVSIKESDKNAWKAAHGLDNLTGKAAKQADTQATLALLTEQTSDAQGAFAREADTAAGQQARATAATKDATAALGRGLLPIVAALAPILTTLAGFIERNGDAFKYLIPILGAAAAAIWIVNAAMLANPATLIIAGIAALVAGIVLLIKNWDKVTAAFKWFWNWLKKNWPLLLAVITGPFGLAVAAIIKNWKKIKDWFRGFAKFAKGIFRAVRDVAKTVFAAIRDVIKRTLDTAKRIATAIKDKFAAVFRAVRDVVRNVFAAIREIIARVIDTIVRVVGAIRDRFNAAWRTAREVVRGVITAIRGFIQGAIDKIKAVRDTLKNVLNAAWKTTKTVAKTVWDAIKGFIQWPIDKVNDLIDLIADTLNPIWDAIKTAAEDAFGPVEDAVGAVKDAIQWVIDKVNALIGLLPSIKLPSLPSWVPGVGKAGPGPAHYAAPTVAARGAAVSGRATSSGGITINVTGALDPDAVARQIGHILGARSRRVGGVGRLAGAV